MESTFEKLQINLNNLTNYFAVYFKYLYVLMSPYFFHIKWHMYKKTYKYCKKKVKSIKGKQEITDASSVLPAKGTIFTKRYIKKTILGPTK